MGQEQAEMSVEDLQEQLLCYAADLQELMLQYSQLQKRFEVALHAQAGTSTGNDLLIDAILHANTLHLVTTPEGDIILASEGADKALLGAGRALLGRSIISLATPTQQSDLRTLLDGMASSAPSGAAELYTFVFQPHGVGDASLPYDALVIPVRNPYRPTVCWLLQPALGVDASDVDRLESILARSEIQEGWMLSDTTGKVQAANMLFSKMTGYDAEEMVGKPIRLFSSDRHPAEFYQAFWDALLHNGSWTGEFFNRRKNGQIYAEWKCIKAVKNSTDKTISYLSTCSDVSHRKSDTAQLIRLAYHDTLTGLPNRRLLEDRMTQAIGAAKRDKKGLCVLFIDLDRFKPINDEYGHDIGDLVLQEIGARLKSSVRQGDTVARVGGDEFVIVLRNIITPHVAETVANTLLVKLTKPIQAQVHRLTVSASIGCATYPQDGQDIDALLRNSDVAMYHAKQLKLGFSRYDIRQPEAPKP
jgi:diguanylate cyclase (GGDEF)-like protein/PAS domain S-box-containing protein